MWFSFPWQWRTQVTKVDWRIIGNIEITYPHVSGFWGTCEQHILTSDIAHIFTLKPSELHSSNSLSKAAFNSQRADGQGFGKHHKPPNPANTCCLSWLTAPKSPQMSAHTFCEWRVVLDYSPSTPLEVVVWHQHWLAVYCSLMWCCIYWPSSELERCRSVGRSWPQELLSNVFKQHCGYWD